MGNGFKRYHLQLDIILPPGNFDSFYTENVHQALEAELKKIPISVIDKDALSAVVKGIEEYRNILNVHGPKRELTNTLHINVKVVKVDELESK